MNYRLFLVCAFLLSSCGGQGMPMQHYHQPVATPLSFYVCHGYSCTGRTPIQLHEKDWAGVLRVFKPAAKTAEAERAQIIKAVAKMESLVAANGGLEADRAGAATVKDGAHQMDCIDETVNTDLYLGFLEEAGAFKFHRKAPPLHRGYFVDGMWPHNSAAVEEISNGQVYAIDSYYHGNGVRVEAVPKTVWLDNWRPAEN